MESLRTYKATGLVFGNYWGGGKGSYKAKKLRSETKEDLIKQINEGIGNGSLDSGMGYESVKGAIMNITTITTITHEGKPYVNEETEIEIFGELSEKEQDFLENALIAFS